MPKKKPGIFQPSKKTRFLFVFWIAAFHVFSAKASAQSFTKIVDPSNPVVNDIFNSGGGSWIDVNNDGFLDLFVAHGNDISQNNSLYLNNKNGGFISVKTGAIVNDGGKSIGSVWGDYDNDGDLDAFVTNRFNFGNFFYRGNGDTAFTKITTGPIVTELASSNSSHWIDVDNDGALDLFVVNFGASHFFYRNSGAPAYSFTKIDTGIILANNNNSIVGAWADYNNDRAPDLFIGNGSNENNYLFTHVSRGAFTRKILDDGRSTLGASWGDYDNDGDLDLFVANFLNQNNILYKNTGAPNYALARIDTGIVSNDGGSSVGSAWGDYDNDGDLDLFVANDIGGSGFGRNYLYENSGPPHYSFRKITAGDIANDISNSFGCAWADYDRDGDLDMFVANRLHQKNLLYRNNGNSNHWIEIKCAGMISNRTAIGTKVRLKATINGVPRWQMQEATSQSGYNSQNLNLHFGLGDAAMIDSIKVEWPSGMNSAFENVPANRLITIREDGTITSIKRKNRPPADYGLEQNYPNPFWSEATSRSAGNPTTTITYALSQKEQVQLRIYNMLGEKLVTLVERVQEAGAHSITWDGRDDKGYLLPSGVYFCRITTETLYQTKKLALVK